MRGRWKISIQGSIPLTCFAVWQFFLMILAHSVYFFHSRDSHFLLSLETLGNTVCYITFLLVSGAVSYLAYLKDDSGDWRECKKRIFKRALLILISYYLLALVLSYNNLVEASGFDKWRVGLNIILFRHLPSFTEYMPPLIAYSFLLGLLPQYFKSSARTLKVTLLLSLLFYSLGYFLFRMPVPEVIQPWKAFLSGGEGLYRFPILQYLPVYLIGLYWGSLTYKTAGLAGKKSIALNWFIAALFVVIGLVIIESAVGLPLKSILLRWPPTIAFLATGLSFAFGLSYIFYRVKQLKKIPLLRDFLLIFGQNAFALFWSHIFLLSLYQMAGGDKVSSHLIFFFIFIVVVILSLALATFIPFNYRFNLTFIRNSHEDKEEILEHETIIRFGEEIAEDVIYEARGIKRFFFPRPGTVSRRVVKKRHLLAWFTLSFLCATLLFPTTLEEIKEYKRGQTAPSWWSDESAYRLPLVISNEGSLSNINESDLLEIEIDHRRLVSENKSRPDGADLNLVYWTGNKYRYVESVITNLSSNQTVIRFGSPALIKAGKSDHFFYLYYGNSLAAPRQNSMIGQAKKVGVKFRAEESFSLLLSVTKTWNLLGEDENINFQVRSNDPFEEAKVAYKISGTSLQGELLASDDNTWQASVPLNKLRPGKYRLEATLESGGKKYSSQKCGFIVSYPLYVAWTEDWEGYDVDQAYLDAVYRLSQKYDLPITHFFNPRIYLTNTISPERAAYLTRWVNDRLASGDDFGLHLHMFYDLVQMAGVEAIRDPNWGDGGDGYGVPTSAYGQEDLKKIIAKAIDLMVANGFPRPTKYRAGGWFADQKTLEVLDELDFKVDSSGRTGYNFGPNNLPGYWDLLPTTKPYKPSLNNQNKGSLSNTLSILEVPNNGADSYWFSASVMIDRFKANFKGDPLEEKQQITYLSHPHWFKKNEQDKIDQLFSYIGNYTAKNDQGPVVYATTEKIYRAWMNDD